MIASNLYLEVEGGIYEANFAALKELLRINDIGFIQAMVEKTALDKRAWYIWFDTFKSAIFAYFHLSDLNYKVRFIRGANHFKDF